jgi:hypothetical protein
MSLRQTRRLPDNANWLEPDSDKESNSGDLRSLTYKGSRKQPFLGAADSADHYPKKICANLYNLRIYPL